MPLLYLSQSSVVYRLKTRFYLFPANSLTSWISLQSKTIYYEQFTMLKEWFLKNQLVPLLLHRKELIKILRNFSKSVEPRIMSSMPFTFTCTANIYLFRGNNGNTRKRCEICSQLTIKTQKRRHWCRSGVFVVFEPISQFFLVFLLLTLNN